MAEFDEFRDFFEQPRPGTKATSNGRPSNGSCEEPVTRATISARGASSFGDQQFIVAKPGPPQSVLATPPTSLGSPFHERAVADGSAECSSPSALSAAARIEAQVDRIATLKNDLDISSLSPESQLVVGFITQRLRDEINDLKQLLRRRDETIRSDIRNLRDRLTSLESKMDDCNEKLRVERQTSLWCCFG